MLGRFFAGLGQLVQDEHGRWDEQALLSIIGVLAFWFIQGWAVMREHQTFSAGEAGVGFAAVMGATLGGLAARERSNKKGDSNANVGSQPGA